MADDTPTPDPRDEKIASLEAKLGSMEATLQSLGTRHEPQQQMQQAPLGARNIPPHIRQHILSQGITEAELDANAPLVMPFINSMLGAAAVEITGMLNGVKDDIKLMKMAGAKDAKGEPLYPFLDKLEDAVGDLRTSAARENRYFTPEQAYQIAYAQNERRLRSEAGESTPAGTRSRDASTGDLSRASTGRVRDQEPKQATTAAEIREMPAEDRSKLWEQLEK